MKYWVGVTDNEWFEFLANRRYDEVNFWQPSAAPPFTSLDIGTPFLFKLKRPNNHIAGGGYFVKFSSVPLPIAWDAFGPKNGAESLGELDRAIRRLAPDPNAPTLDIGCTVLAQPFFFPRESWIPAPEDWSGNIVRGKTYDTSHETGHALWERVSRQLRQGQVEAPDRPLPLPIGDSQLPRYGTPFMNRARLGQGAFRMMVMDAYDRRCAITGESTMLVLEAAHILPFAMQGPNETRNGLLLRADFHKLFDNGLVTVTPNYEVRVSRAIRDRWFNGKAYYRLDGQPLAHVPDSAADRPSPEFLRWHSEKRFTE